MTEPVATLPACLCGLDTNPVASPRMDIHCPKHDAPEVGGEPELLRVKKIPMTSTWSCPNCNHQNVYREGIVSDPQNKCAVCGREVIVGEIRNTDTRVSQPAGEPSDEEFNPWYENYEKALVAEVSSPTPADEVARAVVGTVFHNTDASHETLERTMIERVALAEARRAGTPTTDARTERRCVLELIGRFQREPTRSQGTVNALEWLRRQIAEGNHVHHAFQPPTVGRGKPDECFRCGLPANAIMHLLARHATSALSSTPSKQKEKEDV